MRLLYYIVISFAAISLFLWLFDAQIGYIKSNYVKPDTSIVVTNGKPDTLITKRTLPWYLK